ncbi:hypothetical protein DRN58_09380 [Thermococci archaeon]|nr:MAG: hypothetical protein DRN58_09380 [Thermococci archaeon]
MFSILRNDSYCDFSYFTSYTFKVVFQLVSVIDFLKKNKKIINSEVINLLLSCFFVKKSLNMLLSYLY